MIIDLILGVPGVGKSTISHIVSQRLRGVLVIDFADLMLEESGRGALRDDLQHMPLCERRSLFDRAKERLRAFVATCDCALLLLECHLSLRIGTHLVRLGDGLIREFRPAVAVLVDAVPAAIAGRRVSDQERKRAYSDIGSVMEEQCSLYQRFLEVLAPGDVRGELLWNASSRDDGGEALQRIVQRQLLQTQPPAPGTTPSS